MDWLQKITISIPSWERKVNGKYYFCIVLYTNYYIDRQLNGTISNDNELYGRREHPFSSFYSFYNKIIEQTKPCKDNTNTTTKNKNKIITKCICQGKDTLCPFYNLYGLMKSYFFPKRRNYFLTLTEEILESRRLALEKLLQIIVNRLREYPSSYLTFDLNKCIVLKTLTNFLSPLTNKYSIIKNNNITYPLTLDGWRDHLSENCDDLFLKSKIFMSSHMIQSSNYILPKLCIKEVDITTTDSILQDVRMQLLNRYGTDIDEISNLDLNNNEINEIRLWELAFYIACKINNIDVARLFYLKGGNINSSLKDGTTCLNIASRMGNELIIDFLLNKKANVNLFNKAGICPLIAASRNGHFRIVKKLIQSGSNIYNSSLKGTNAIHAAIVSKSTDIVQYLLQNEVQMYNKTTLSNILTKNGTSPLHFAAKLGLLDICKLLINQYNADIYIKTSNNMTAWMIAQMNQHHDIVSYLVDIYTEYQKKQVKTISNNIIKNEIASNNTLIQQKVKTSGIKILSRKGSRIHPITGMVNNE